MEKYLVDIYGFNYGEISDYISSYNKDYNYYMGAKKLENMLVSDNNVLIRRFNSNYVRSYPKEGFASKRPYPAFYFSFEHNGNIVSIEAQTKIPEDSTFGIFKIYINDRLVELEMPYNSLILISKMTYTTDLINNKIYFFSENKSPFILKFNDNYQFFIENINFVDGPFLDANIDLELTITPSATEGKGISLTLNKPLASSFATSQQRYIRIAHNGIWGIASMYARQGDYIVKADIIKPLASTLPTNVFKLGAYEAVFQSSKGTLFANRLYLVGNKKNKKYIFASKTNEFHNFATTDRSLNNTPDIITTDSAIAISLTEGKEIMFIASLQDSVVVGTQEGLFNITPIKFDEKISAFNYKINKLSSSMCGKHYVIDDNKVIYSDYFNKNLYLVETYQDKVINFQQINLHCKHLFTSAIKKILITYFPFKILWILLENGRLLSASFITNDKGTTFAFSKHFLGGKLARNYYISKAYNNKNDCLFVFCEREDMNLTAEVINLTNLDFLNEHNKNEIGAYLDCKTVEQAVNGTIFNLAHYSGAKVHVVYEGNTSLGDFVVENGKINLLENLTGKVEVGFLYPSLYQTPYITNSQNQSSFGLYKTINNITVGFINTQSIYLHDAFNTSNKIILNFNKNKDKNKDFTYSAHFKTSSSFNPSILLTQNNHTPMNILFLKLNVLSN